MKEGGRNGERAARDGGGGGVTGVYRLRQPSGGGVASGRGPSSTPSTYLAVAPSLPRAYPSRGRHTCVGEPPGGVVGCVERELVKSQVLSFTSRLKAWHVGAWRLRIGRVKTSPPLPIATSLDKTSFFSAYPGPLPRGEATDWRSHLP